MRVLITGGTGLIGRALVEALIKEGHIVTVLSRRQGAVTGLPDGVQVLKWDGRSTDGWGTVVNEIDAIVNLAGESIGGSSFFDMRWTPERKAAILQSRLDAGRAVLDAIQRADSKPSLLIQSSAIGYYGTHKDDRIINEAAPAGHDFLADVCRQWEDVTAPVEGMGVRRVILRTGVVLDRSEGVLPRQSLPFKLFAGGPVGSGRQWLSWIHIKDMVAAIQFLLEHDEAAGVFNLSAPGPVTNAAFGNALGRAMGRPSFIPAPGFALQLLFGEAATLILDGQRVVPERLQELGFKFEFPEVQGALKEIYS